MPAFCRDCLVDSETSRCHACGSPRILQHEELDTLAIAHMDCDSFYASVEKRDDPDLHDKPVIVGGGKRGVVSAACYVARTFGVHSAMPMYKALKACPNAVVIRPDMKKYVAVSRQIKTIMQDYTPLIEPLSLDEAFLDMTGTARLHGRPPAQSLARMIKQIENHVGVSASIGLSYNKFLAKVASDLDKPRGFAVIGEAEAKSFLAKQPVSIIWGAGKALQKRLAADGITTVGHLQKLDEFELIKRYGSMGQRMARFSHGHDGRKINPRAGAKSVSSETTFNEDIHDAGELARILWQQSERVSTRLKKSQLAGSVVNLKLRTTDFKIRTRSSSLPDPTQLADIIYQRALQLLNKEADGTKFRLLGVGVSHISDDSTADPIDLGDPDAQTRAKAERALDQVRERFGEKIITKGRGIKNRK